MECEKCRGKFADGFLKGRDSVFKHNKSGCVCTFDDHGNIISICDAHKQLLEDALKDYPEKERWVDREFMRNESESTKTKTSREVKVDA